MDSLYQSEKPFNGRTSAGSAGIRAKCKCGCPSAEADPFCGLEIVCGERAPGCLGTFSLILQERQPVRRFSPASNKLPKLEGTLLAPILNRSQASSLVAILRESRGYVRPAE